MGNTPWTWCKSESPPIPRWIGTEELLELTIMDNRRLASKSARKDFLTKIIEARKDTDISDVQIAAHSSDFVFVFLVLSLICAADFYGI